MTIEGQFFLIYSIKNMSDHSFPPRLPPQKTQESYKRLQHLANLLDNAFQIPGTNYSIGIDPLLGLFPAIGDYLGLILSSYLIWESAKLGVSQATLWRMVTNIVIDLAIGAFPLVGDFFDVTWKANQQNLNLLKNHLQSPPTRNKVDKLFLLLIFLGLILLVTITTFMTVLILKLVWSFLSSTN
jgi:hypothetical protein